MFGKQVWMQVRQFHGIANQVNLTAQTTDIFVLNIGDFLENEFLYLGLGDTFEHKTRATVQE